jgi:hypothetical protein
MDYSPQELYRYDTTYYYLQEANCRGCHGDSQVVAERHHLTDWVLIYNDCLHCHPLATDLNGNGIWEPPPIDYYPIGDWTEYQNGVRVARDCKAEECHEVALLASPPNGNGWHHNTSEASSGQCNMCHNAVDQALGPGCSLVDCPRPLDILPTVFDCQNCHWKQSVSNQNGDPANPGHPSTYHHYDEWGGFVGFYEYPLLIVSPKRALHMDQVGSVYPQCYMCHSLTGTPGDPGPPVDVDRYNLERIRHCQRCHTQQKLHEIHVPSPPDEGWDSNGWEAVGFHVPLNNSDETDLDPANYRLFTENEPCVSCHSPTQVIVERIILKDLGNNLVTRDFKPGTNIQYKVKFTVMGLPAKQYKVVVTGKAFSLYKPDGTNREWRDKFDNPKRKNRKLPERKTKRVFWDRQIPANATPGTEARVRFTLKLKEWDEATETWNLSGTYYAKKKFNIVP